MARRKDRFVALSAIEYAPGELRLDPGDPVTREELHAAGQSDEDIDYLLACDALAHEGDPRLASSEEDLNR